MKPREFFEDLLKDPKTDKWSLGRVFTFALLTEVLILNLWNVVKKGEMLDVPTNMLYLLLALLGYNQLSKYLMGKGDKNGEDFSSRQ
ncbi:MAG: hypothetical protein QXF61_09240 [Nitrososphaeria archaeon]